MQNIIWLSREFACQQSVRTSDDILKDILPESNMKTYLEIHVPLRYDAVWFQKLRDSFDGIPVWWQQGFFHITMAFCDETPEDVDLSPILDRHFSNAKAPEINFDKLDAFETPSGMYIIDLTTSHVPDSFHSMVEYIREDLKRAGCCMNSCFKLHVTLGRLRDYDIKLPELQNRVSQIPLPEFKLKLTNIDYRVYRGEILYQTYLE